MKLTDKTLIFLMGILMTTLAIAHPDNQQIARQQTIKAYLRALQQHDKKSMLKLFGRNGRVVSTSRGRTSAEKLFTAFLPSVRSARVNLHQTYMSLDDHNRYGARFHFTWKALDGSAGGGEYVDEFIFEKNSDRLKTVYMFENLKW